jgi:hypothetical protein
VFSGDLCSSGMLHNISCQLVTDVSGWPVITIVKGEAFQEECQVQVDAFLCSYGVGINWLSRKVPQPFRLLECEVAIMKWGERRV